MAKTARIYEEQLREEVKADRAELGKSPVDDDDDDPKGGGTAEKTVSTTDPDCGMFVKGEYGRQFAYGAHTACDKNGMVKKLPFNEREFLFCYYYRTLVSCM